MITTESIKKLNRAQIADLYAIEITKEHPMPYYAKINRIILTKYKNSGLIYIKELAWKILKKQK